jgi:hypothetical protein
VIHFATPLNAVRAFGSNIPVIPDMVDQFFELIPWDGRRAAQEIGFSDLAR